MPPKNKKVKKIVKRSMVVQGFNVQGDNNLIKSALVENNVAESGNAEEELIVQGFNINRDSKNNVLEDTLTRNNEVVGYESESDSDKVNELKEKLKQNDKEIENLFEKQRLGLNNIKKIFKEEAEKNQVLEVGNIKLQTNESKPNLKHIIGKGGYGEVHYAKWGLHEVAVKKLHLSSHNIYESNLKEIQKEIDILKNLRNRYIIQYYDTYSDNQELLIIMEYAENGTLTKFINDNKNKEYVLNFNNKLIKQMTLGLDYIHQKGIIHRDLKSMNILLTKNNDVKISDFGLAKTKDISSSQSEDRKGTWRWMAPEVIKGELKCTEQSDIYSLGMIIWEISAKCTKPFKNIDDKYKAMLQIFSKNKKETIPTNTSQNVRTIIQLCWKDNPNERIKLKDILEIIEGKKAAGETSDEEIQKEWENCGFTYNQTRDWLSIGLQPTDSHLAAWLRDELHLTPEEVLNSHQLTDLQEQFTEFQSSQEQITYLESKVEQPPKGDL